MDSAAAHGGRAGLFSQGGLQLIPITNGDMPLMKHIKRHDDLQQHRQCHHKMESTVESEERIKDRGQERGWKNGRWRQSQERTEIERANRDLTATLSEWSCSIPRRRQKLGIRA